VTLASFNGSNGESPFAGLVEDRSGNLFGTTGQGGAFNDGTVFKVAAGSGSIITLASFNGPNGQQPVGGLVEDSSGNLFGTTYIGGASSAGTVFEVVAGSGSITTLASFNGANGAVPDGGVVEDRSGNLFGTTLGGGGPSNDGTVFELAAGSGSITTLASFNGANGGGPAAGLVEDRSGNLFGTTELGGASGDGTVFEVPGGSTTFTVTTTADSGPGSLRQAILDANAYSDPSAIAFDITAASDAAGDGTGFNPSMGVATFTPQSPLPAITNSVLIDGYSQPGAQQNTLLGVGTLGVAPGDSSLYGDNTVLNIVLNGSLAGNGAIGLTLAGSTDTVQGLVINQFDGGGIWAQGGAVIQGNFLGTDVTGTSALGNSGVDVALTGSGNTVGGTAAADRNLIDGVTSLGSEGENHPYGSVLYAGPGVFEHGTGDLIEGNFLGTDASGTQALGSGDGVQVQGTQDTIGGIVAGAGNLMSGNISVNGFGIFNYNGTDLQIQGNFIGTDVTGTVGLGNYNGIVAYSSGTLVSGNLVSGNRQYGVEIGSNSQVQDNLIGTDVSGNPDLGNGLGVNIEFASGNTVSGNTIEDNNEEGITLFAASGNTITGNTVKDNGLSGAPAIYLQGASNNTITGNTLADNRAQAVLVAGVNYGGFYPAVGNTISQNVIYGNGGLGIDLNLGNYIGGSLAPGNDSQAAPVLTGVATLPTTTTVTGTLASTPNTTFTLEFFATPPQDTNGVSSGEFYLGHLTVTTDSNGNAAFVATSLAATSAGEVVDATATNQSTGDTSEFSNGLATITTPQLQNGTLAIPGTDVPATFTLTPVLPAGAAAYSMKVTRTIGTTTTHLGTFAVPSGIIEVYGGPSTDAVTLKGTPNSDAFAVDSGTVSELAAQDTAQATSFTVGLNAVTALTLKGDGGSDSLAGPNQTNAWAITGGDAGTLNGSTSFTGIGNLIGGTGNDTFSFGDGSSVSGTIDGGGGSDTLDFSARTTAVTVTMEASGPTKATATGGWTNIATVIGSAATTNTLVGADTTNVWDLTGSNAGSLDGALAFAAFQNLTGGATNDTFAFLAGGSIAGNLKGGAPVNTLDYSGYGSPVTLNLQTKTATGIGGTWAGIQDFIGTGTTDTLLGANANSTWSIAGANAGTVGAYSFAGFPNLTGGTGNSTFKFAAGASMTGTITGGGGTNTLDYSAYGSPVTVNLQTTTTTGIGTWANIQSIKGTDTTDTLIATDGTTNTWALKGTNAGTVDGVSFIGFANLTGGSGADVFQFAAGAKVTGVVNGQGGSNTLDYSAFTGGVTVNLGNTTTDLASNSATAIDGGAANGIANIGNVIVGSGNNYLTAVGVTTGVTFTATGKGNNILVGGSGNNTLTVSGSGNNIVIGDQGASTLSGGTGYNLLIGGYTAYDSVYADLESILGIWKTVSSAAKYAQAISKLTALSYAYSLSSATVHSNASDTISAGTHTLDWYFAAMASEITGVNAGETVTLC